MNELFSVVAVESLGQKRWRLRGRAYDDIHIGDVMTAKSGPEGSARIHLQVKEMFSYQRQITEINRMMTGDLIVQADLEVNLENVSTLFRKESVSD